MDAVADSGVRRQIQERADLTALARDLGFDLVRDDRARLLMHGLRTGIRSDAPHLGALQASVSIARSQATEAGIDVAIRRLFDRIAAAGYDQAAVTALLNSVDAQAPLPFVELIPVVRNGERAWRTPVDYAVIRRRPVDVEQFERDVRDLDALFAAMEQPPREAMRVELRDAAARVLRDVHREKAYLPTALQTLDRKLTAFLAAGATPVAATRFVELCRFLAELTEVEQAIAAGARLPVTAVTQLASDYTARSWLQVPSLSHRMLALLLARPYISAPGWYRRRRFFRAFDLVREEITRGHYDGAEVARRLQQLEQQGAFFSSLVYPLLRGPLRPGTTRPPAPRW